MHGIQLHTLECHAVPYTSTGQVQCTSDKCMQFECKESTAWSNARQIDAFGPSLFYDSQVHSMDVFMEHLSKCERALLVTGAGISRSAGLPTFRSASGLFSRQPGSGVPEALDFDVFVQNPEPFYNLYRQEMRFWKRAQPTLFHHFLFFGGVGVYDLLTDRHKSKIVIPIFALICRGGGGGLLKQIVGLVLYSTMMGFGVRGNFGYAPLPP